MLPKHVPSAFVGILCTIRLARSGEMRLLTVLTHTRVWVLFLSATVGQDCSQERVGVSNWVQALSCSPDVTSPDAAILFGAGAVGLQRPAGDFITPTRRTCAYTLLFICCCSFTTPTPPPRPNRDIFVKGFFKLLTYSIYMHANQCIINEDT